MTSDSADSSGIKNIDPITISVLEQIDRVAKEHNLPYLIIGASARMLLLEGVYGLPAGRRTMDLDFAFLVGSWLDYQHIRQSLLDNPDFKPVSGIAHRLRFQNLVIVDIIPCGRDIEDEQGKIEWPGEDTRMSVLPLEELLATAITITLKDTLAIPIISPEGLFVSKLFAWRDRRLSSPGRDASDIAYLLRHIIDVMGGVSRLFSQYQHIVELNDFKLELAAAHLLGMDSIQPLSAVSRSQYIDIINETLHDGIDSALVADLERKGIAFDGKKAVELITAIRIGINSVD